MTQPCRPALRRSRHLVNPAATAGSRAPVRYPDAREELSDAIQPLTSAELKALDPTTAPEPERLQPATRT